MREPISMEECVYFTNRIIDKGKIKAWVFKESCPKCKKSLMSKPKDEKTNRPKIRATIYMCPSCNFTIDKQEYEDSLTINVQYTCPHCSHSGELSTPFLRKKTKIIKAGNKKTVNAVIFECKKCKEKLYITKKLA